MGSNAMGRLCSGLMVVISTQSAIDLAPMSELIDYGLKVQAGEIEDRAAIARPRAAQRHIVDVE